MVPDQQVSEFPEAAKDRGHLSELMFAVGAKKRGYIVCTPGGDNCPFDVVLYNESGRFIRVQIKSCLRKEPGRTRHSFTVKRGSSNTLRAYNKSDVDVLALYAFDEDAWFFVPIEAVGDETYIKIDENSPFLHYKNNWSVFL